MEATSHRSTQRVLDILTFLAQSEQHTHTLAEIALALDAPKSSLFPILQTMTSNSVLNYNPQTQRYSLGIRIFEIGMQYLQSNNSYSDISREIRHIAQTSLETCNLGELIGNEVCYLMKESSPETIRMFSAPGKRMPAHSTALGKVLLCEKTWDELKTLFPNGLAPVTNRTITDLQTLFRQLKFIREQGYGTEDEENELSVQCIAIPLRIDGHIRYALSVSIPKFRYTAEKGEHILRLLLEHQSKIEAFLSAWNITN